jgi:hypothetical protein
MIILFVCDKCDTHDMCHTVSRYDTIEQKVTKIAKNEKRPIGGIKKMRHYDTYVTPKVFKFIGPSNDIRRHNSRGTYLFPWKLYFQRL